MINEKDEEKVREEGRKESSERNNEQTNEQINENIKSEEVQTFLAVVLPRPTHGYAPWSYPGLPMATPPGPTQAYPWLRPVVLPRPTHGYAPWSYPGLPVATPLVLPLCLYQSTQTLCAAQS